MLVYDSINKTFSSFDGDNLIVGRDPNTKKIVGFVLDDGYNSGYIYFVTSSTKTDWDANGYNSMEELLEEHPDLEFKVFN